MAAGQRVQLHRRIGLRKEVGYGAQVEAIAAELAQHFAQGHDTHRAMRYLRQAADMALRRYANTEAIAHLTQEMALLSTLPETPEREQQKLELLLALGPALMAAKG
jgi:predicted ATPase